MAHHPIKPAALDIPYTMCATLWLTKVRAAVFGFVHFVKTCARARRSRDVVGGAATTPQKARQSGMIVSSDFMILLSRGGREWRIKLKGKGE